MRFTIHAEKQARRRGIRSGLVNCVLNCGEEYKAGRGCSLYRVSRKEQRFLKHDYPQIWKYGRDQHKVALVLTGNEIVTVMHRVKPLNKSNRLM